MQKNTIVKGTIFYYNCRKNRGKNSKCKARIKQHFKKNNCIEEISHHGPKCNGVSKNNGVVVDAKAEVEAIVNKLATENAT